MPDASDSNLVAHAERELDLTGLGDPDADYGGAIATTVLDLVKTFAGQGHSGGTAFLTIQLLERLLRYEPLTPLTGGDDEWRDVREHGGGDQLVAQNIRDGRVMRRADGSAYMVHDGDRPATEITFPYLPTEADR